MLNIACHERMNVIGPYDCLGMGCGLSVHSGVCISFCVVGRAGKLDGSCVIYSVPSAGSHN